jgi:hypothetical protein
VTTPKIHVNSNNNNKAIINNSTIESTNIEKKFENNNLIFDFHSTNNASNESSKSDEHKSRNSIVFFSGPIEELCIETLTNIKSLSSIDKKVVNKINYYPPIKSGDHLKLKLDRTNGMN